MKGSSDSTGRVRTDELATDSYTRPCSQLAAPQKQIKVLDLVVWDCQMRGHGGNLDVAYQRFGRRVQDGIDLSTGINRQPFPVGELPLRGGPRC
jgi:hypothetical protein